jgi:hypothetical protein
MAAAPVDVVGSSPITFTGSQGQQRFVPLSALQFNGSTIEVKTAWSTAFDPNETNTLITLATAYAAAGELTPPPVAPPSPAVLITAAVPGPESNDITVTATPDAGTGLATKVKFDAKEVDTYAGLTSAKSAALAMGVDAPTGNANDPVAGTGVLVLKTPVSPATFDTSKLPTAQNGGVTNAGYDVKAADNTVLFTLLPRGGYAASGGLSFTLTLDGGGTSFTITATYDSKLESGTQAKIAVNDLGSMPAQVAFLITASAPPAGALLPAAATVQLSGGGPGLAANTLLYTS